VVTKLGRVFDANCNSPFQGKKRKN
jgi:hypothetical protein